MSKCKYWNEEHQEYSTSFEEDIRTDEREKTINECIAIVKSNYSMKALNLLEELKLKEVKMDYITFNSLTEEERKLVENIAKQLPFTCEDVADIFVYTAEKDIQKTKDYFTHKYGYIFNQRRIKKEH